MSAKNSPTRIGISCGDPNGIGIETVLRVFADDRMFDEVTPVLYAHAETVAAVAETMWTDRAPFWAAAASADAARPGTLTLVPPTDAPYTPVWGATTAEAGGYAFASLERAVNDLAGTRTEALVTAPIHKDAIRSAGFAFPGHTEYLAAFANVDDVLMLLASDGLRIGMVTGHVALRDVPGALSVDLVRRRANRMHDSLLRDFGIPSPRIAVLGLNPHASDNGLMGDEEKRIIAPVVRELAAEGMCILGPYAADGFFGSGAYRSFDGVLAMYHDQGLAPFKALSFGGGVNFTAGLPIVRTSPDHGTGFDIAGQGKASGDSMRAAMFMARDVLRARAEWKEYGTQPLAIDPNLRREEDYRRR
jgi:4-hydroxythreonine-4-phosphate dehydrogenase